MNDWKGAFWDSVYLEVMPIPTGIDPDIEEMLTAIEHACRLRRLLLFNDDVHGMEDVVRTILRARFAAGRPCTVRDARNIMMEAHLSGEAIVLEDDLFCLRIAQEVLENVGFNTRIVE